MNTQKSNKLQSPTILATDLDGTLIPLDGNQQNLRDLKTICSKFQKSNTQLLFVTGRHFRSVLAAIDQYELPMPDWILCDVGTSVFQRSAKDEFAAPQAYIDHLQKRIKFSTMSQLHLELGSISGLRIQEAEKQGRFKLSYYTDKHEVEFLKNEIDARLTVLDTTCQVIASVDPFNGNGLIDVLPPDVSKAFALNWWLTDQQQSAEKIVFAGDSGNDLAALTAGYATILVGNATAELTTAVTQAHTKNQWTDRLFVADAPATSGVLAGCEWFRVFDK